MPNLQSITALGAEQPRVRRWDGISLTENSDVVLASVALLKGAAQPAPFGLSLPPVGGWSANDDYSALWMSPGQWLVEGKGLADADFAAEVASQCPGCAVTEQTDGFVVFEIGATAALRTIDTLLAKLVNLDPAKLTPGTAARTLLGHMTVLVVRRSPENLAIIGMRSYAESLWHDLETVISRIAR